jgi:hypothetical protein
VQTPAAKPEPIGGGRGGHFSAVAALVRDPGSKPRTGDPRREPRTGGRRWKLRTEGRLWRVRTGGRRWKLLTGGRHWGLWTGGRRWKLLTGGRHWGLWTGGRRWREETQRQPSMWVCHRAHPAGKTYRRPGVWLGSMPTFARHGRSAGLGRTEPSQRPGDTVRRAGAGYPGTKRRTGDQTR